MSLQRIINELTVTDIEKSQKFYQDLFHFEVISAEGDPINWVELMKDNQGLMLEEYHTVTLEIKNFPTKTKSNNLLKLEYDNQEEFQELYDTCKRSLIKFFIEYHETEYGKIEFGILDPDENMIIVSYLKSEK